MIFFLKKSHNLFMESEQYITVCKLASFSYIVLYTTYQPFYSLNLYCTLSFLNYVVHYFLPIMHNLFCSAQGFGNFGITPNKRKDPAFISNKYVYSGSHRIVLVYAEMLTSTTLSVDS